MALAARCIALVLAIAAALLTSQGGDAAAAESAEAIRGFFRVEDADGRRVALRGIAVTVATPDGAEIGAARSGGDGAWSVAVPGPGAYVVRLDAATVPESHVVRAGSRTTLTVNVLRNQKAIAVFPLVPRGAAAGVDESHPLRHVLQLAVDGLVFGVVLAIASIGLSLIYGVTRVVNFAHGDVLSFGALVAVFLNASLRGPQLDLVLAALIAVAIVGSLGVVFEDLFRRVNARASDHFTILVFSIGISFVLRHALLFGFGPASQPFRQYVLQDLVALGPVVVAPRDLSVVGISLVLLVGTGMLLLWTRLGQAMRAVATNPHLAEQSGIDIRPIRIWTWVLGTALAAAGGVLLTVSQQARWDLGYQLLMFVFAAVILGGIGTAFGAMVGGILIGLIAQLSTLALPAELKPTVAMTVLVLILLVRPLGLFNRAQRVG